MVIIDFSEACNFKIIKDKGILRPDSESLGKN